MFVLHETTQRWLCRIAFLVCCVAPTLWVVSWAAAVNTPQYESSRRAFWEARLQDAVGMPVKITRVSHPSRGVTLLEGVEATPFESTLPIMRARLIEIRPYENGYLAMASQLEVDVNRIGKLWSRLHDQLFVRCSEDASVVWLRCAELTLVGDDRGQTIVDVSAKWNAAARLGPTVLAEFNLPERSHQPCQLAVHRERGNHVSSTVFDLQTHDAALPCSVLGQAFALVDAFGNRAQFRGRLSLKQSPQGYSGSITEADITHVETQRLLAPCSLHTLRTIAHVRVQSAEFEDGRLLSIAGGAAAEFGVIDAKFIAAMHEHMQIAVPPEVLSSQQEKWSFRQLAIDFALNERDGLYVQGACEDGFQGAMLVGDTGPLLLQPQRPHQTAVALIRTLVPANDLQAPATRQTQQLTNVLPVPDIRVSGKKAPSAVLRLRQD